MTPPPSASLMSHVRWDGQMVLFDLDDGTELVACAVSRSALEQLGPSRCFKKDDALACFARSRELIEGLALTKLRARADGACGRLTLWADDVAPEEDPALQQMPA